MRHAVFFDLDGTLFLEDDRLAQEAMVDALSRLTRTEIDAGAFEALDHHARPARWLAREVIRRNGLRSVDLGQWAALVEEIYLLRLAPDASWSPPNGTAAALAELVAAGIRPALVTGVPKRVALERVTRLGLADAFASAVGAYGSETEDRAELFRLALARAGVGAADAVHVGDTSRDVTCCNELGIAVIATAFDGRFAERAREADGAVRTMPDLVTAIRRSLSSRGSAAGRRSGRAGARSGMPAAAAATPP